MKSRGCALECANSLNTTDCGEVHMARRGRFPESLADKVYNELRTAIVLGEMARRRAQ